MRTDYKRIFAPGSGGVATYFAANDRVEFNNYILSYLFIIIAFFFNFKFPHRQWNTAYHQGMTAGYNTLALVGT